MNNFQWFNPFTWFKSEEREALQKAKEREAKLETLVTDQRDLIKKLSDQILKTPEKPYRSIRYIAGSLVVVLHDGLVLEKQAKVEDAQEVAKLPTEAAIIEFFTEQKPKPVYDNANPVIKDIETHEEKLVVLDNLRVLRDNPDFDIRGDEVYLTSVNVRMPAMVIGTFIELLEKYENKNLTEEGKENIEERYETLRKFWIKLALNPIPQSRLDLLSFVKNNDIRLTRNGNMILYRRVVSKNQGADKALIEAITIHYGKVKKMKKSPKHYNLFNDGGYVTAHINKGDHGYNNCKGNLYDLYNDLPNMKENTYTAYQNNKVDIKLGAIYYIPDEEINLNNGVCAAGGLHAANVNYNYEGYGDVPVVVLVNPSKAITVPTGDIGKLRTTEMFVACVNDKQRGQHFDDNSLSVFDEEYSNYTIEQLEEAARTSSVENLMIKTKEPEKGAIESLAAIITSLKQDVVNHLKERVVEI